MVRTDQRSLKFLLEQRLIAVEYQRWIAKLMGFDFTIEYKKGVENSTTDALSCLPPVLELGLLSVVNGLNSNVFLTQIKENETLNGILQDLINKQPAPEGYGLGGLLTYKGWLVLPADSPTIPLLLTEFHTSPVDGHQRVLKTYQCLS